MATETADSYNDSRGKAGAKEHSDSWFFPEELKHGLEVFDLPDRIVEESLACAWEYARCVIPEWTNWERYLAFNRTIIIAIIAEFRGDLIPGDRHQKTVGYNLGALLVNIKL